MVERKAALDAAEINLGYTDIVSPTDGTVASRQVQLDQTVAADSQTPLFVIAAGRALVQINASIGAKDSSMVTLGDKAIVTVEAVPGRLFSGIVTQIRTTPQSDEQAATSAIVISAPNPDLLLTPGMAATVSIMIK